LSEVPLQDMQVKTFLMTDSEFFVFRHGQRLQFLSRIQKAFEVTDLRN